MHQEEHVKNPDLEEKVKVFDVAAEEGQLPRFNIIQQIVNHVKGEGLQTAANPDTGISHYGLEIRLRTEGQIPTDIVESKPEVVHELTKQLVVSVLQGMFLEIVERIRQQQQQLVSHLPLDPSLADLIEFGDETISMVIDLERYWNQPVMEKATPEVQEIEIPVEALLPSEEGVNNG